MMLFNGRNAHFQRLHESLRVGCWQGACALCQVLQQAIDAAGRWFGRMRFQPLLQRWPMCETLQTVLKKQIVELA
jgi:hypothetical protein